MKSTQNGVTWLPVELNFARSFFASLLEELILNEHTFFIMYDTY